MKELLKIYERLHRYFGPQHWWPGDTPFEVAVGAILTQNTNWGNVEKAIQNLENRNLLTPHRMHGMPESELAKLIKPAGYFNVKARRLRSFLEFFVKDYDGRMGEMAREDLGHLRTKLLEVHGIGPETADSILLYALQKPVFVIDAYTKRVLSRHGIMESDRSYDEFQGLFHDALPRRVRLYNEFHALLVRLGKDYCKKSEPLCSECPLSDMFLFAYQESA